MTFTILHGKNLDILPTLPDNSVDSIVTDPPYELGFMGKKWDSSGIAYSVELWTECLRVLKPGGHLLSFGGTRTFHRVAVAIEDSGFEIRDNIAWLYGSGFPKSLDVSKAIDKRGGKGAAMAQKIGEALRQSRESRNISKSKADEIFCAKSSNWSWFEGRLGGQRPPSPEVFAQIIKAWPELSPFAALVEAADREITGTKFSGIANKDQKDRRTIGGSKLVEVDITVPSTPEAEQWNGWGTALKPAHEPIIVARKPLEGTVAHNVLTHGTGALNIDGSRVGGAPPSKPQPQLRPNEKDSGFALGAGTGRNGEMSHAQGRWPANIILDEHTAGLLDEQSGFSAKSKRQIGAAPRSNVGHKLSDSSADRSESLVNYGDSGGASRFFYVAKASKRDRNEGLDEMPIKRPDNRSSTGMGTFEEKGVQPQQNFHPTVKPTALMEYLVKLVTPPNGTVLDPFTGSGSTGKAAILNGFDFIGIEMTEDYLPIIKARLEHAETEFAEAQADKGLF